LISPKITLFGFGCSLHPSVGPTVPSAHQLLCSEQVSSVLFILLLLQQQQQQWAEVVLVLVVAQVRRRKRC